MIFNKDSFIITHESGTKEYFHFSDIMSIRYLPSKYKSEEEYDKIKTEYMWQSIYVPRIVITNHLEKYFILPYRFEEYKLCENDFETLIKAHRKWKNKK
jgi:hypothetical protein